MGAEKTSEDRWYVLRFVRPTLSLFISLLVDLKECNLSAAIQVESEFIQLMK